MPSRSIWRRYDINGALPLCCSVFLPLSVIRMSPCWGRVSHIRDLSTCSWLGIETDVRMMHHQLRIRCNPVRMGEVYTGSTLPGYCIKYDVLMCVRALLCMCVRTIYRLWTSCVSSLAGVESSTSLVGMELDGGYGCQRGVVAGETSGLTRLSTNLFEARRRDLM